MEPQDAMTELANATAIPPEVRARMDRDRAVAEKSGRASDVFRFFAYSHLPEHLQAVSRPIGMLAEEMILALPDSAERTAGLRKLLEAKDCFVRAKL